MADTSVKQQIIDKIKDCNNVLVTVSSNPSVDELSAALGITLFLNKLNKHATAVFSGDIPPAIQFLNPEKTFENTVDSLRDFIIALSKDKADHLRYKVVDDMVKIFITPYRTTISEKDLDFSQGDYNVECVLAIGVKKEQDLDRALASHGRILHDATVVAVSLDTPSNLGGIEWADTKASSFCEMIFSLTDPLKTDKGTVDEQIATAFLTGIVAATDRFSNQHTNASVMTVAAQLMSAGANQQLIASNLQANNTISSGNTADNGSLKEGEPADLSSAKKQAEVAAPDAGSLAISHVPSGTLEQVEQQISAEKSEAALAHAEEALASHTQAAPDQQEVAEQALAAQLPGVTPAQPAIGEIQQQIGGAAPVTTDPLRSTVDMNRPQGLTPARQQAEPTFGGTLNATTEQAAFDKQREIEQDRNRTLLSHGGSGYASSEPTYQAPFNAAMDTQQALTPVADIFAQPPVTAATAHVDAVQPPVPTVPAPTLAEIDAQNRAIHTEAVDAVNQAFASAPAPAPVITPAPFGTGLPPLPPMPDFSTLPPLPGTAPLPADPAVPASAFGGLPPINEPQIGAAPITAADPAQFRIPGQ
ncbi:MAG: hypothetical protein WAQ25_00860 [Candidatus Saccharimonas sp.]